MFVHGAQYEVNLSECVVIGVWKRSKGNISEICESSGLIDFLSGGVLSFSADSFVVRSNQFRIK